MCSIACVTEHFDGSCAIENVSSVGCYWFVRPCSSHVDFRFGLRAGVAVCDRLVGRVGEVETRLPSPGLARSPQAKPQPLPTELPSTSSERLEESQRHHQEEDRGTCRFSIFSSDPTQPHPTNTTHTQSATTMTPNQPVPADH